MGLLGSGWVASWLLGVVVVAETRSSSPCAAHIASVILCAPGSGLLDPDSSMYVYVLARMSALRVM